jgi:hypothetical protein
VLEDTIYVPDFHTYGGLRLESSGTESLVVKLEGPEAGFTAVGRPLDITDRIGGSLQIVGQPSHPVVFTSFNDCTVGAGFTPDGDPQTSTNGPACEFFDAVAPEPIEIVETTTDGDALRDALLGPGVTAIGNSTLISGPTSAGIFRNGLSTIGIDSGVVLATGEVFTTEPPNDSEGDSFVDASLLPDADLDAELAASGSPFTTTDTTSLEFDFQLDQLCLRLRRIQRIRQQPVRRRLRVLRRWGECRLFAGNDDSDHRQHRQRWKPAGLQPAKRTVLHQQLDHRQRSLPGPVWL